MRWSIHHVNLPAPDMAASAKFYETVLGLSAETWTFPSKRGAVSDDPMRLRLYPVSGPAQGANEGLHLIEPDPAFARENGLDHNPSIGGHVAIQVEDLDAVIARLEAAGINYSLAGEYAIPGMRHVYVYDPGMNLLEINEFREDQST
ncbi:VOC family protein [Tropicimonas marinistellae]|uniref:VOC family protein n=1 Tax=Tropicimonas marinistellae TaxID=1739787 RepID=UPI0008323097|nr:VOC family protein [Tropicimonas marinistellae]